MPANNIQSRQSQSLLQKDAQNFILSLTSGVARATADLVGGSTLYAVPLSGDQIALYDGSTYWNLYTSAQIALTLAGLTSGKNYDVFSYYVPPISSPAVLSYNSNPTGTTPIAAPSGTAAGDTLVAFIYQDVNTAPTGWTLIGSAVADSGGNYQLCIRRTANGTSDSISPPGAFIAGVVLRCTPGIVVEAQASTTGSGNTIVAPTVTSGGSNRLLLSGYFAYICTTIAPPAGQTTTALAAFSSSSSTSRVTCGYETISSSGATGTRTATASGNTNSNLGFSVLLKAPATGLSIDLGTAWTNNTTRALALTTQNGVYVNSSSFTGLINGSTLAAGTARYIGTIRATAATTTEDSVANRNVFSNDFPEWRPCTNANRVGYYGYGAAATVLPNAPIGLLTAANNLSDVATRQTALNNLAGSVTAGYFPRGDGTNITMSLIQAGDIPTLTALQLNGILSFGTTTDTQVSRSSAGNLLVANTLTTGGTGVAGFTFSSQTATAQQNLGSDVSSWQVTTDATRLAKRVISVNSYAGLQTAITIVAGASVSTVTVNGNLAVPLPVTLTPVAASFTGTQTAYAPTGFPCSNLRLTGTSTPVIQGISSTGIVDGMVVKIRNVGATSITIAHNNSGASAANRIYMSSGASDVTLAQHDYLVIEYDSTLGSWRCDN